jgi:hypothetical protein
LRKFLEIEADLGSDNEDNDVVKVINRNDLEENEDGHDEDLQGFVVHGDDQEIGGADDDMRAKYLADAQADDRARIENVYKSIILGQNRKRKRGEVDLAEGDDWEARKLNRFE